LLAKAEHGSLIYAGTAFFALPGEAREELRAKIEMLAQEQPTLSYLRNREAWWVRPELALKVRHPAGGKFLRHATVRQISG
jgi:hypothetical protein